MKIAFQTLGCKLNYAETSTYERGFVAAGWEVVPWQDRADVYLINTCAVTEHAEKKARNLIRKMHRTAPEAAIVVTGCYAELRREQIEALEGVVRVFGAAEKRQVVSETIDSVAEDPERKCSLDGVSCHTDNRETPARSAAEMLAGTCSAFAGVFGHAGDGGVFQRGADALVPEGAGWL